MLDHDQGVAEVAQPLEGVDQLAVVALMQPDRGLVEDVEDAHQARPDLGRQPDPLRLPPRQRRGDAAQRQVLQTDVDHEAEPLADLLADLHCDRLLSLREFESHDPLERVDDAEVAVLGDVLLPHRHRQRLRLEAATAAGGAWVADHEPLDLGLDPLRLGLLVAPFEAGDDAFDGGAAVALAAEPVAVGGLLGVEIIGAVKEKLDVFVRQVADRRAAADVVPLGDPFGVLVVVHPRAAGALEGAVADRERLVRQDGVGVDLEAGAQAGALGAGAVRAVEGEVARLRLFQAGAAMDRAGVREREQLLGGVAGALELLLPVAGDSDVSERNHQH